MTDAMPEPIFPLLSPEKRGLLLDAARCARQKALAVRSRFTVGAALLSTSGRVFCGCNVEVSGGYGVCAESVALGDALTRGEHLVEGGAFLRTAAVSTEIVVDVADPESMADGSPCGICRQALHDFCLRDGQRGACEIVLDDGESGVSMPLSSLLPFGFHLRVYEPDGVVFAADCETLEAQAVADSSLENLLRIAREISVNAAAQTRGEPEGAVVVTRDGRAFCGVSVENSNANHYIRALQVAINRAVVNGVVVACADQMDFVSAFALFAPSQSSARGAVDPVLGGQFFAAGVRGRVEVSGGVVEDI